MLVILRHLVTTDVKMLMVLVDASGRGKKVTHNYGLGFVKDIAEHNQVPLR